MISVTINISVYNTSPDKIENCINSCLNQNFSKDYDILIYDNGSDNQDTIDYLNGINNDKITLLRGEVNRGISYVRNIMLKQSKGTYIVNIDPDDTMELNRLASQYAIIRKNQLVLLANDTTNTIPWHDDNTDIENMYSNDYILKDIKELVPNPILLSLTCIDKVWIKSHNIRYNQSLQICNDYKLYVDIFKKGGRIMLHHEKLGTHNYKNSITDSDDNLLAEEYSYVENLCQ